MNDAEIEAALGRQDQARAERHADVAAQSVLAEVRQAAALAERRARPPSLTDALEARMATVDDAELELARAAARLRGAGKSDLEIARALLAQGGTE